MNLHPLIRAGATLLFCATFLSAQTALYTVDGSSSGERLSVGTFVGDVNGDGIADFALGAPRRDLGALVETGRVELRSGLDGSVLWTRDGALAHERLGASLAGLHDVNGDGVPDLAVGAPSVASLAELGRVLILSGDDGSVLNELSGVQPGGEFGASLAGVGDLDADGSAEIIVGAPSEDRDALDTGTAYVLDPLSGGTFSMLVGFGAGDNLGRAVSGGSGSLVANTLQRFGDNPTPTIGFGDNPTPTIGAPQGSNHGRGYAVTIDPFDATVLTIQTGAKDDDRYGSAVVELGDFDGDGVSELAIGSDPRWSPNHPTGEGYLQLLDGVGRELLADDDGTEVGDNFGIAIADTGDVNGDGVPDYLVGEAGSDVVGTDAGRAVLYSGADRSVLAELFGATPYARFGSQVIGVGDLNGDGLAEFAISAPDTAGGTGRVTVYTLSPWTHVGGGNAGSQGIAELNGRGGMLAGHDIELELLGAAPLATARVVYGTSLLTTGTENLPTPSADAIVDGLVTDADGALSLRLTWPSGVPSGTTTWFQVLIDDGAGGESSSTVIAGTTP